MKKKHDNFCLLRQQRKSHTKSPSSGFTMEAGVVISAIYFTAFRHFESGTLHFVAPVKETVLQTDN